MRTVDERLITAPAPAVYAAASDVERWPALLPHYRYVRMLEHRAHGGVVEMSANRPFGPLDWPTWWTSEMWTDPDGLTVCYRHIRGITTGMDVEWQLEPRGDTTFVRIVHEWEGPRWPLISGIAANLVIGPVFVHGIASRTLAGLARHLEGGAAA